MNILEKTELNLGFIPLLDSAPLVIALERGYFAEQGLKVTLRGEFSWATIRDKVSFGLLDGAQMLAPMPLAASLGLGSIPTPMVTAFSLGLNGNAITLSNQLWQALDTYTQADLTVLERLKAYIEVRRQQGKQPLKLGIVYPYSQHNYLLRYWLASGDILPDRDVDLPVISPTRMIKSIQEGLIDGFCVGEPWNTVAEQQQVGRTAITGYQIWNNAPEKVFGVTQRWADENPNTHQALLKALLQAALWLDNPDNRQETLQTLSRPEYLNLSSPEDAAKTPLLNTDNWPQFFRYSATFPWHSHARWLLQQMLRWQQLPVSNSPHQLHSENAEQLSSQQQLSSQKQNRVLSELQDYEGIIQNVYRTDLYRKAAAQLSLQVSSHDNKPEGQHDREWQLTMSDQNIAPLILGPSRFIDGEVF